MKEWNQYLINSNIFHMPSHNTRFWELLGGKWMKSILHASSNTEWTLKIALKINVGFT